MVPMKNVQYLNANSGGVEEAFPGITFCSEWPFLNGNDNDFHLFALQNNYIVFILIQRLLLPRHVLLQ